MSDAQVISLEDDQMQMLHAAARLFPVEIRDWFCIVSSSSWRTHSTVERAIITTMAAVRIPAPIDLFEGNGGQASAEWLGQCNKRVFQCILEPSLVAC
jgi:hypothetical protein